MVLVDTELTSVARAYGSTVEEFGDFPSIIRQSGHLTHLDLWRTSLSFADRIRALGIPRGGLIAVNTGDIVVSLATMLASSLLGIRLVVASHTLAGSRLFKPDLFLKSPEAKGSARVDFEVIDESWYPHPSAALTDDFEGPETPEADWLYLHTSGTTGQPKYFALSESCVLSRSRAVFFDFPEAQITLATTYKVGARPFFARATAALLRGCAIVEGDDPEFWLNSGVNFVSGSPSQLSRLLQGITLPRKFECLETAGAPLSDKLAHEFLSLFERVTDIYGAGETNKTYVNVVSVGPEGRLQTGGFAVPGSTVQIVDDTGYPQDPGKVGKVRVRNNHMISGYLESGGHESSPFLEGWFYPGDLGCIDALGALHITGRTDDVLNIGGYKINANLVDAIVRSVPGVEDAISIRNPIPGAINPVLVFVVFKDPDDPSAVAGVVEQIRQRCHLDLSLLLGISAIREIGEVPYNEAGKPSRRLCEEMVLARERSQRGRRAR
ncbi:AMP-binding protein [Rhodobacterales bacterium HKCCSP123]|nr:AMP-binding protein [Rhodobacterales bacterium HKCCSP123]